MAPRDQDHPSAPAPAGPPRGRVLHVAHQCLPHIGGLETVAAAETRGLARRGWEVTLVSSAGDVGPGTRVESGVRTVRVRAWNGLETRYAVPFPVFSPWLLVVLWREVRRAGVVHVHDVLYLSSWAAVLVCLLLRRPYVVHRHVGHVHHSSALVTLVQRAVTRTIGRVALRRARTVLPIDEHVADDVRAAGATRVEVLGNGVDTTVFRPLDPDERRAARTDLGLPADRPLVLFVGRFVPKKGFPWVVAAASDHYDLVLVGGDRPAGVPDDPRLHFPGGLPADLMPRVYGCADVMVVASVGECPLTVLESMSSGLPLVAHDDPALHSPWTAGPGVRFVDLARGGLRATLEELVADPDTLRRDGAAARAHVVGAYSWEAHLDRLEALYHGATSAG